MSSFNNEIHNLEMKGSTWGEIQLPEVSGLLLSIDKGKSDINLCKKTSQFLSCSTAEECDNSWSEPCLLEKEEEEGLD